MTKYTKIIAALGVAAGLGVASLPAAGVFAAEITGIGDPLTASDEVEIEVRIAETLSLELDANKVSADMTIDEFLPGAQEAAEAQGTPGEIGYVAAVKGGLRTLATVKTNASKGYTLNVIDKDEKAYLGNEIDAQASDRIAPVNNASADNDGWTLSWNNGNEEKKAAMVDKDGTPIEIKKTTKATVKDGEGTTINYDIKTREDQSAGTYSDTIVYTAIANAD